MARGRSALQAAVAELHAGGAEALGIAADVRDSQTVAEAMETVRHRFGGLHALINNAGIMMGERALTEITPTVWREIIETNLSGAFHCIHAALPLMLGSGGGIIINLSSGAAVRTGFLNIPYGVSKAGLDRLTLGVDAEMREQGIRCISLSPSMSATATVRGLYPDQDVAGAAAPPDDTAKAIEWLLREGADQFGGQVITVKQCLTRNLSE